MLCIKSLPHASAMTLWFSTNLIQAGFFPLISLLLPFKSHYPYMALSKCAIHCWMGGEVATQVVESWLTNISASLQTPSSSHLLACSAWKGFVMEDVHGQEGSKDNGPGAIAATCLDIHLKGQPTNNPNVQPTKLSTSAHWVHPLFVVGGYKTFACAPSDPGTSNNSSNWIVSARAEPTLCWMCSVPHYVWGMPFFPHRLLYPPNYERGLGCLPCCSNICIFILN